MATRAVTQVRSVSSKRKSGAKRATQPALVIARSTSRLGEIAASEFKAKCLAILQEVNRTGREVIITKRGKAIAKLIPFEEVSVESLFGRMKGLVEIVGDPDDLIKPAFPLEDWESLQ